MAHMQMKKLIVGNWKMNPKTSAEASKHFAAIKKGVLKFRNVEAAIAAPFVHLPALSKLASAGLALAAQNVSTEKEGAFTGEVSAAMLKGLKTKYVIVGHSERRAMGETNATIVKKVQAVLASGMTPILCVGETERDHDMWYLSTVKTQVEECFAGIAKAAVAKVVIAYEPVWALSTTANRRDATPEDYLEMRIYIRKVLSDMFDAKTAEKVRVLYGGSVDEKNAIGFLITGHADGLLPGRASLTPKKFVSILQTANNLKETNDLR
jgi:triosephosphate isomerase